MFIIPAGLSFVFILSAFYVGKVESPHLARKISMITSIGALILSILAFLFDSKGPYPMLPQGWVSLAPIVTVFIALVASGMGSVITHDAKSFKRILLLIALAEAFLATTHP